LTYSQVLAACRAGETIEVQKNASLEGKSIGSQLRVIASGAFEAFKRRAAEPIGCALTRQGQDERDQPHVLLAAFRVSALLSKRSDRSTATFAYRCGRAQAQAAPAATE